MCLPIGWSYSFAEPPYLCMCQDVGIYGPERAVKLIRPLLDHSRQEMVDLLMWKDVELDDQH